MSVEVDVKPALTDQQARALEVVGASVALSAGAGCGKTRVLTERYLRYLDGPDRRPLRSIVALTFTEKAARELRNRVRRACRDRLDSGDEPVYWRSVLRGLEAAPIGTFHAFCGELLRRFSIEAGVEPGFAVMEETMAPSLRDAALADALRDWLASQDDDLTALAVEFGLPAVRQAITDLVADRGGRDYASWAGRDPAALVAAWREFWEREGRPCLLAGVVEAARPGLELFDRHVCSHKVMNQRIAFLREQLPTLPHAADPLTLLDAIREHAQVRGGGSKDHWPSPDVFEAVKDGLTTLRKGIDKAKEQLVIDESATALAAEFGIRFARLASRAVKIYADRKGERGSLDFDDLLDRTRDLLRHGPDSVRQALRDEIGVLLVDEFQDTDPVQAEILELLAGSELCAGRIFLVGDTKQSIYRFRGAQPHLFQLYRDRFPDAGRLNLTENFRSAPGVIAFVNALFSGPFPAPEHRLEPRSTGFVPTDGPAVAFLWAFDPDLADHRGKLNAEAARTVEARWLARHLAARLKAGWPIWDEQRKLVRDAEAGDIVFLLRTLNDAAAYENALVAEGLDYYVVGGSAFFAQQEVLDLSNLLTVIEDPLDEVALAGLLRSPFFGLSDEGLYWLVTGGSGNLPAGLERRDRIHDLSDVDRHRGERAHALLTRWRAWKDHLPIAALLDRMLVDSGYEAALLGEHLGPRKRANARKLVRLARRFDAQGGYTLADFAARLRADLRKPPREEQASTTDEHGRAVRLMSIHQAKGLEFPIVVVPDMNRDRHPNYDRVAFHPELGPVVKPTGESDADDESDESGTGRSLGWTCHDGLERREDDAEAIRLFYVAATRARESLILSAGLAPGDRPRSPALTLLASRFDLATGAVTASWPDDRSPPSVQVIAEPPPPIGSPDRRKQPRLLAAARAIERGASRRAEPLPAVAAGNRRRPRVLDLDPSLGLDPTAARLDRLTRAILADPASLDPASLPAVAARVGRALVPMATPDLIERAVHRLAGWLPGPIGRELRRSSEIRRAFEWRLAWPPDGSEPTLCRGTLELAYRDASGFWTLIALADAAAPVALGRLRLLLSARAAGLEPVARGWLVRFGREGGFTLTGEEAFDDHTIELALDIVLNGEPGPGH